LRYEVLGPLTIIGDDGSATLTAHKMEVLLATLLSRAEQVVTTGQIYTELWGERAPRRANASLHVYISQLRRFLDRGQSAGNPIATRPPGYLIRIGEDELDANEFQAAVERGRNLLAAERYEEAAKALQAALAIWRGPALEDLCDGPIVNAYVTWLEESRIECIEMLVEAHLKLHRHREVIGQLHNLIAAYPLREVFYRYLMLALHYSERRAEALQVYQTVRKRLNEELGIEPCWSLRELQQRILNGDRHPEAQLLGSRSFG